MRWTETEGEGRRRGEGRAGAARSSHKLQPCACSTCCCRPCRKQPDPEASRPRRPAGQHSPPSLRGPVLPGSAPGALLVPPPGLWEGWASGMGSFEGPWYLDLCSSGPRYEGRTAQLPAARAGGPGGTLGPEPMVISPLLSGMKGRRPMKLQVPDKTGFHRSCGTCRDVGAPARGKAVPAA